MPSSDNISWDYSQIASLPTEMARALVFLACWLVAASGFIHSPATRLVGRQQVAPLPMELELNTATYIGMFVVTIVPSIAFVKFVGDASDASRGSLSAETKEKFTKSMMEQPGANLSLPTSEEEALKKAIAKAYIQDKDVDVAVLEEKLRKRAQWRKEAMASSKGRVSEDVDEEGW